MAGERRGQVLNHFRVVNVCEHVGDNIIIMMAMIHAQSGVYQNIYKTYNTLY